MPYIGNDLATQFQAFATQTITGDGSTSYTLDRAVANGKELLVYINNVKQEEGSGKSYEASGTTITFSEAVASGDSCYLVYMGSAQQTVTPPAGSLGGYTGNASLDGAVTINESSADVDFRVESDANTHALFVEGSSGNVGIGTSSPGRIAELKNTSNPALRLNNGTDVADIGLATSAGALVTGSSDGALVLARGGANVINFGTNGTNRFTIGSSGDVTIADGDLVIGTAGHGISFAATSDASGMTSEVLDDYEEGTWTPTLPQGGTVNQIIDAHYVRIGLLVQYYTYISITPTNNSNIFRIGGIPYTPIQYNHGGGSIQYSGNLDTHYWSGPLVHHDGYVYFHRLDGNSASIVNSAFGGSQTSLIVHGVYSVL